MGQTLLSTLLASMIAAQSGLASMAQVPQPNGRVAARLLPMTERELEKLLDGCLDSSPYPADGGPTCFYPDGVAFHTNGWGGMKSEYKVVANKVIITDSKIAKPYSLSFYRNRKGQPYYHYDSTGKFRFLTRLAKFTKRQRDYRTQLLPASAIRSPLKEAGDRCAVFSGHCR